MGEITEELSRAFRKRRLHPCLCPCNDDEVEYVRKVTVSVPRLPKCSTLAPICPGGHHQECCTPCLGYVPCRQTDKCHNLAQVLAEASLPPSYWDRRHFSCHQYSTLDGWFKRYDYDGDGYLNLSELRYMLDQLGAPLSCAFAKRLLDMADTDGDGKLSFREFLLLWKQAGIFGDHLCSASGGHALRTIIREFRLYPNIIKPHHCCLEDNEAVITEDHEVRYKARSPEHRLRCCGFNRFDVVNRTPYVESTVKITTYRSQLNPNEKIVEREEKISMPSFSRTNNRMPVFSCNRLSKI